MIFGKNVPFHNENHFSNLLFLVSVSFTKFLLKIIHDLNDLRILNKQVCIIRQVFQIYYVFQIFSSTPRKCHEDIIREKQISTSKIENEIYQYFSIFFFGSVSE